jgi:hypothetical protein
MATFSKKMMGKEVGSGQVYAQPHDMSGNKVSVMSVNKKNASPEYAMEKTVKTAGLTDPVPNGVSYSVAGEPKTSGIKMRGAGCATKGTMSRGPMA